MNQTAVRSGRIRLEYLVCDGASTDGTLDVVRDICGDRAEMISEKDGGMYEALAKGLRRSTGELVSYLNAGDFYAPTALDVVADIFEHLEVDWVTGLEVINNLRGQVVSARTPCRHRRRFARKGLYGSPLLPFFIQQEATFWRRRLLSLVDLERLATFRLAGDSYMWKCFAREAKPLIVSSYLGGRTRHPGQLSSDIQGYRRELRTLREPLTPVDVGLVLFDRIERWAPMRMRKWLDPRGLLMYSHTEDCWR